MGKKKKDWSRPGKVRVELRFDQEAYDRIKQIADEASISFNQLMNGLAHWVGPKLHVGEPYHDANGAVDVRQIEGCVFVGQLGSYDMHEVGRARGEIEKLEPLNPGEIIFSLDFTERRVVRDADEKPAQRRG